MKKNILFSGGIEYYILGTFGAILFGTMIIIDSGRFEVEHTFIIFIILIMIIHDISLIRESKAKKKKK